MSAGSRRCIGFGLGATAGAAVCAMFTTGFGPGWGDRAGLPPATAAEQLPAFEDCAELRGWYVDVG